MTPSKKLLLRCFFLAGVALVSWFLAFQFREMPEDQPQTIRSRLHFHRHAVRERLSPWFDRAGVPYPPVRIVLAAFKEERVLELYAAWEHRPLRFIRSYPILAASGHPGPKLREGDRQVPEGLYRIEYLNPNSRFHLSMKLDYPNAFDRRHAAAEGRTEPGSDIMIHGKAVSIGCLAMGDEAAEELFILAAQTGIENVEVVIAPVDFRVRSLPEGVAADLPHWTGELYTDIRRKLAETMAQTP